MGEKDKPDSLDFGDESPRSGQPSVSSRVETIAQELTLEQLKEFLGSNAEYYLKNWQKIEATGKKETWNWSAFVFSFLWAGHRKLFQHAVLIIGIQFTALVMQGMFGSVGALLSIVLCVGCAVYYGKLGNYIYLLHVKRVLGNDWIRLLKNDSSIQKQ